MLIFSLTWIHSDRYLLPVQEIQGWIYSLDGKINLDVFNDTININSFQNSTEQLDDLKQWIIQDCLELKKKVYTGAWIKNRKNPIKSNVCQRFLFTMSTKRKIIMAFIARLALSKRICSCWCVCTRVDWHLQWYSKDSMNFLWPWCTSVCSISFLGKKYNRKHRVWLLLPNT